MVDFRAIGSVASAAVAVAAFGCAWRANRSSERSAKASEDIAAIARRAADRADKPTFDVAVDSVSSNRTFFTFELVRRSDGPAEIDLEVTVVAVADPDDWTISLKGKDDSKTIRIQNSENFLGVPQLGGGYFSLHFDQSIDMLNGIVRIKAKETNGPDGTPRTWHDSIAFKWNDPEFS